MTYMLLKTQLKKPADTIYTNRTGEGCLVLNTEGMDISWYETAEVTPDGEMLTFKNKLFGLDLWDGSIEKISYSEDVFQSLRKITVGRVVVDMKTAFVWQGQPIQQFVFGKAPFKSEEELLFIKNAITRSENDRTAAQTFVGRCTELIELHQLGRQKFEKMKLDLRRECRSSAMVDLKRLGEEYFPTILFLVCLSEVDYMLPMGSLDVRYEPITSLSYDLKSIKHNITPEMCAYYVEKLIREMIVQGDLNGVIDKEKRQYVDRSFGVKEQRVVNIQVDFNSLVRQLGNKGIALTSVQCPQCGAPSPLPQSGDKFHCSACGCLIQATDLFEKFKVLLG